MKLKFKPISSVILSARMEKALYKGIDFGKFAGDSGITFQLEEKGKNINMIYPFYSYEDRGLKSSLPFSHVKEYYIPASSLKGALLGELSDKKESADRSKVLFSDIRIEGDRIKLRNLYKFQYLYQEKKEQALNENKGNNEQVIEFKTPKFSTFFPAIAIEMLDNHNEFEVEILQRESEEFVKGKLNQSFEKTREKLRNYMLEAEIRKNKISSWIKSGNLKETEKDDYMPKLEKIIFNLQMQLSSKKNMIFLGGYKGILASLSKGVKEDSKKEIQNGFYIDENTLLPYGLVEVILQ
ncbi:MAG: hypothetical protein Q4A29_06955 [Eubacteriales bacterium]|nr:hypothetical protein [Eubacteriales bacterium]